MAMHFSELKAILGQGLLSFPVTDFAPDGAFSPSKYAERVEWLSSFPVNGLFAAGGTGEFFSIGWNEYSHIIKTAVMATQAGVPIVAGVGYGTKMAVELAREAEAAGADGILLLPHYLTEASDDGIEAHVAAVCRSVDIGIIYYARGSSRLKGQRIERLAERHPNLIGYKDGLGDIHGIVETVNLLGDRLVYIGGLPTAEIYASAYLELGATTYSSAVFNFAPEMALEFYQAVRQRDRATVDEILRNFFIPLVALRDRKAGYAVSMIKAGCDIINRSAGAVRTPLTSLSAQEVEILRLLLKAPQATANTQK
jgi:5-dehydro-4-deoxyglucarate dehydratase